MSKHSNDYQAPRGVLPPGWVAIPLDPTEEQWTVAQGTLLDMSWPATTCLAARVQALIAMTRQQWQDDVKRAGLGEYRRNAAEVQVVQEQRETAGAAGVPTDLPVLLAQAANVLAWAGKRYRHAGDQPVQAQEAEELSAALRSSIPRAAWQPQFDVMSPKQEALVQQFCAEIAGPKGKPGRPPDPVRLLEMAEALYQAEREECGP